MSSDSDATGEAPIRKKRTALGPYKGPHPLDATDTLFGRAEDLYQLWQLLTSERIVVLHSPSGAGKSSLINAGLIPKLANDKYQVLKPIRVGGNDRLPNAKIGRFAGNALAQMNSQVPKPRRLSKRELESVTSLSAAWKTFWEDDGGFRAIVFDQFEELVTTPHYDDRPIEMFFDQIGNLLENRTIWSVFAIREDYLGGIEPYADYMPGGLRAKQRLDLLTQEAAVEAIQGPPAAKPFQVEFEKGAAQTLARTLALRRDATGTLVPGKYVEPVLLQVVCTQIWDSLPPLSKQITSAQLPDEADVSRSLARFFDDRVKDVSQFGVPESRIRSWVSEELINGNLRKQTLKGPTGTDADGPVLAAMVDGYLLRQDFRGDTEWFELVHDRMVEAVHESNLIWELELPAEQQFLHQRAKTWIAESRDEELLLRGVELFRVRKWADAHALALPEPDREYLGASIANRNKRKREKYLTTVAAITILFSLIAASSAILVSRSRLRSANGQVTLANAAVESANQSKILAERKEKVASANLASANSEAKLITQRASDELSAARRENAKIRREADAKLKQANDQLHHTEDRANQVDRDRKALELQVADKSNDLDKRQREIAHLQQETAIRAIAAQAEQLLASPTYSVTLLRTLGTSLAEQEGKLIQDGEKEVNTYGLQVLRRIIPATLNVSAEDDHSPGIYVGYDPKQKTLITGLADARFVARKLSFTKGVSISDCSIYSEPVGPDIVSLSQGSCKGAESRDRDSPPANFSTVTSSSKSLNDGGLDRFWAPSATAVAAGDSRVALGFFTGIVEPFEIPSGSYVPSVKFKKPIRSMAFSQDGNRLAASTSDSVFKVSDIQSNKLLFTGPGRWLRLNLALFGHRIESVSKFAFGNQNVNLLAAGHDDGRVEIWDTAKKQRILRLCSNEASGITSLSFSADDRVLLATVRNGSVLMWEMPTKYGQVRDRLRYTVTDTSALCNEGITSMRLVTYTKGTPTSASFSPDGQLVAIGDQDRSITFWSVSDGRRLLVLPGHIGGTMSLRFLSNQRLASVGNDGVSRIWAVPTRRDIEVFSNLDASLQSWADSNTEFQKIHGPSNLLGLLSRARTLIYDSSIK